MHGGALDGVGQLDLASRGDEAIPSGDDHRGGDGDAPDPGVGAEAAERAHGLQGHPREYPTGMNRSTPMASATAATSSAQSARRNRAPTGKPRPWPRRSMATTR